jgi:P27 family predicted phage terminase small subunit
MGKRGPKKKPTALRKLEGNPGRLPINELEPVCEMPAVKPSAVAMDEIASLEWDRLMHAMPPGLYTALDVSLVTQYALAWSMLVKAQSEIDSGGIIAFTEKGYGVSPAVKVWKAASETLLKCADRLGLHPGARTRLEIPSRKADPTPGAGSKFAGFLGATKQ